MSAITSILPPELLSRIFSFLAFPQGAASDITRCRLVCQDFRELSSPYLITQLVLAMRSESITRIHEICQHSYFSRFVSQLIYDASRFDSYIADDLDYYIRECEDAPRELVEDRYAKGQRPNEAEWQHLRDLFNEGMSRHPEITFGQDEGAARSEQAWVCAGTERRHDSVYLYKSYERYCRFEQGQQRLEDLGMRRKTMVLALKSLPELRTLTYTDYRSIARPSESCDALCRRLFGRAREPDRSGAILSDGFAIMMQAFADHHEGTRIESIKVEPHPFVRSLSERVIEYEQDADPMEPIYLPFLTVEDVFRPLGHLGGRAPVLLKGLRQLRLPIALWAQEQSTDFCGALRPWLSATTTTLTHLCLDIEPQEWTPVLEPENEERRPQLVEVFTGLPFEHLRTLDLRRWMLPTEFQDFLRDHSPTLRFVHLLACLSAVKPCVLARLAAEELPLYGVELSAIYAAEEPHFRGAATAKSSP